MPIAHSIDEARAQVEELVERFRQNLDAYSRSDYKEAQVRAEFIDPFLEALGWDVRNVQGHAEPYKEVIHEDTLQSGRGTEAPDYGFRIGNTRKFFLEAKKPSVAIREEVGPSYQLRRYAWSAHLPLSVLTDFAEWAVYDCRVRPGPGDKAGTARILYLTYGQYVERLDEIYGVFGRESVWRGSFDRYAEATAGKRGTSEVDDEFLKTIEGWRDALARNIALRNPSLTVHELNFSVQHTIDRIVFLRMCEDRGIEPYGRLLGLCAGPHVYPRLVDDLYRQADERYNSGLFDFRADTLTRTLAIDDKVLKAILEGLYYPTSPYEFSVLPVEVLGQVYEQFLGKVIRLTAGHQAKVEEKPEVRKAGGVYYTPSYIVDYVVRQTVGRLVEGKSPRELRGGHAGPPLRVLDPACGSGSFLLGAYQFLLDHYRRWYEEHDPASHARGREPAVYQGAQGDWRLTTAEKKRILLDHIYGVDIDRQAVEVTKLSLLLKVLEGETEETVRQQLAFWHERALPDLGKNVQCGNSLIGPDYFEGRLVVDDDEVRRVNPFDWRRAFPEAMAAGGFDVIIGNPPYLKEYTYRQAFRDIRGTRLEGYYQGKMDIWYIFACLALDLLKPGGMHSFIATNNWITNAGASVLRTKIMSESQLIEFVDFGDFRVFESAGIQTMIYVLIKSPKHHEGTVRYRRITESTRPLPDVIEFLFSGRCDGFGVSFDASLGDTSGGAPFTFIEACDSPVLQRIEARGLYRLKASDVAQGIVSPQESVTPHHLSFLRDKTIRPGDGIFVLSSEEVASLGLSPLEDELVKPYYTTRELGRYYGAPANRLWIIYTKSDINDHIHRYPNIRRHLDRFAPVITSAFGPYGLHRAREESFFAGEKLVSLRKTRMPQFTYADFPCYVSQTFYILKPEDINLKYLVGLMNSRLVHFWLDKKGKKQGEQLQVDKQPLLSVPIRTIDFSDPADVARHDRMVALVERMLGLHKKLAAAAIPADKDLYRRQIEATDRQIDALVYELYGLTEQEIAIVEGAAG